MNPQDTQITPPTVTTPVQPVVSSPTPSSNVNSMGAQFKSAIQKAQQDPTSAFATELMTRIKGGQMNDYLKAAGYDPGKFTTQPTPRAPTTEPPQGNGALADIAETGSNLIKDTNAHAANITEDFSEEPSFTGAFDVVGNVAGEVGDFFGEGLGLLAKATTPKPIRDAVSSVLASGVKAVAGTDSAKGWINEWNKFEAQNPNAAKDVGNAVNISALLGGEEASPTGEEVKQSVKQGAETTVNAVKEGTQETLDNAKNALQDRYINQEKSAWAKPTTTSRPMYGKATEIAAQAAEKGHDIPESLVRNGIRLSDNVENGAFSTADTAEKIRSDAGKMSNELLRPALTAADQGTEKTSVQDVVNKTIADIKASRGETPGGIESQVERAKSEGAALERKYPDGMSLTNMHDEKINYNQNGKFSPIGDPAANIESAKNRSFGRVLANEVETKAPEGVPVKQFNAELAKQYKTADYLDALNSKKVPQTIGSRIRNTAGKVAGAAVGNSLGSGILGGVGGYHIGGMVESTLENMSNPLKNYFLKNLETTNPEAFTKIRDYLNKSK